MPDSHSYGNRPIPMVDMSESIKTGHWYEASRPLGTLRSDLLEAVGWLSADPGRLVPTTGEDGRPTLVRASAKPPGVLFILPKEGTTRYRQWGGVLNYLETALVGRRGLSEQHVVDAKTYLGEAEGQLTALKAQKTQTISALEASRDEALEAVARERTELVSAITEEMQGLQAAAKGVAEGSRRFAEVTVPAGALGDPRAKPQRHRTEIRTPAPPALVHALEAARALRRRLADETSAIDSRTAEARRTWEARISDVTGDFSSRVRSAEQRRDSAEQRLVGARKQNSPRVHPALHGQIRAFLDRELLEAARVASDEMRKSPHRGEALLASLEERRRLAED